jgi:hypothetical protein
LGFTEIFPNNVRANGQSFGTGIHWIFAALITLMGPVVLIYSKKIRQYSLFFAFMMVFEAAHENAIKTPTNFVTVGDIWLNTQI